jgi:hypothetical protein
MTNDGLAVPGIHVKRTIVAASGHRWRLWPALLLALLLPLACASTPDGQKLEIVVRQMPDNFELLAFPGPVAIRYQVTVGNPSSEPVTIERLELRTNGPGPYSVPQRARVINVEIAAGEIVTFDFVADAVSRGDDRIMREPVTLSGTAYFRSPDGPFSRSFIQVIRGISEDLRND